MCEMAFQIIQKKQKEKRIEEVQAAKAQNSKIPVCYDDDDDHNSAITPNEPIDYLSIGDEHLDTIPATKSNKFIKSCVENLVPNPSESKGENGCDLPSCFTTFLNILFDADYKFDSVDDQPLSDEDFPEKIFSNPLFEEEIISMKIDQHHFNAEFDLIESMLNRDSSIISSSSKIDSLFDEFVGELTIFKSIPSGIDETDCHSGNEIHLTKRLLYDNSSPRPQEEFVYDNYDADIESFSPSPIPIEDSESLMEKINLSFTLDDPMPPSIEEDDDDSERDILILKDVLDNYSLLLPENKSYHFDIPSFSRPPAKPPDEDGVIISIPPLVGGVADVVVEIKGTEPMGKSKRLKSPKKKYTKAPARGVVIKETHEMPLSKKKEKVDVTRDDSNIEQDSSGEDSDQENESNDEKTQLDNENKSDFEHETNESKSGSESDHEENEEDEDDEEEVKDEFEKTPSNDSDDEDETKITNKAEGDEDEEIDYSTKEGTDAAMTNVQQGNENIEILQVIKDAHVTLSSVPQKTEVLVTSFSCSSNLAAKFLNFSDIPHTYADIVSLMDVHVHLEVPSQQIPTLLIVPVSMVKELLEDAILAKESSRPQSSYEEAATLTEFKLKKILIDKIDKSKSYLAAPEHRECYEGLIKSYDLDKTIFSAYDFSAYIMNDLKITNMTQETLLRPTFKLLNDTRLSYAELEYDFEECYKALSEKLYWENIEGGNYPFDLTKPLPLVMSENRQKVPVDYFFNNDLKYLQGGVSTITYTTSITKTKAAQYDLPSIKEMVEVMRKHWYEHLKEIVVRRANKALYIFKEGDFPCLRINDIEYMLLVVVLNRLKNLSGDGVFDFKLTLRIQKLSYSKASRTSLTQSQKLPEEDQHHQAKSKIRKRDPYTLYQDPQGFIYVDNNGRNRLMRSDELYKFSDMTLTGLRTLLDDITKNI
nr:hypothetical protein [Tanacetum cinerariifolium]